MVESFGTILDLSVELERRLRLIDELVLHLESVDQLNDFTLQNEFALAELARLEACKGWHLKLLDLVNTLVDFARLVHEVFKLEDANRLVMFDSLPH